MMTRQRLQLIEELLEDADSGEGGAEGECGDILLKRRVRQLREGYAEGVG